MTKKFTFLFLSLFLSFATTSAYSRGTLDSVTLQVKNGDTLGGLLESVGFEKTSLAYAIEQLRTVYDPTQLAVGQQIKVTYSVEDRAALPPELVALNIRLNGQEEVTMKRQINGNFLMQQKKREVESRQVTLRGTIKDTLYDTAKEIGLPAPVLANLIKLYSYDVDFQRDIKEGNKFTVLFEEIVDTDSSQVVDYGNILFAQMDIDNQPLQAYRYETADGEARYYDALGKSIEKSLLKTPMDGARITSGFGNRKHPILGFNRMHKGIDFGAPSGTPIYAAGDGRIDFLGRNGSYGNYIRIAHRNNYSTAYAHLRGFKPSLTKGSRVRQGDVIGYVGTTGRSTGPHLHYELLVSNRQVNPLSIKSVPGDQLSKEKLAHFKKYKQYIEARLKDPLMRVSFNDWPHN